ncbi:alpha/beta hydrolase [Brenneria sp. g21c3]|uniref:alpha/beta fold hydrolase n=1 Tax=Brenneria sp. g21c3 TaxID=3093893 RepID=UPI002EC8592B|nr:alpha/beta hydrolase [Brenneria sp. g21c3]
MNVFNHENGDFFINDNAKIYYEIKGNESGYPIIFIHGGMLNIESFNGMISHIPEQYRCIGIDSRGHGKSTFGSNLSYALLQNDVEMLMDHLKLDKCSIVGHSDGGTVALRLAASRPERVEKLITIGAQWYLATDDPAREVYKDITPEKWINKFPDNVKAYEALNEDPRFSQLLTEIVKMWLDTSETGYPYRSVNNISCSTMIIRGDEDWLVPRHHSISLADIIDKSVLFTVPFSNHCVHEERPELIASFILEFLQKKA